MTPRAGRISRTLAGRRPGRGRRRRADYAAATPGGAARADRPTRVPALSELHREYARYRVRGASTPTTRPTAPGRRPPQPATPTGTSAASGSGASRASAPSGRSRTARPRSALHRDPQQARAVVGIRSTAPPRSQTLDTRQTAASCSSCPPWVRVSSWTAFTPALLTRMSSAVMAAEHELVQLRHRGVGDRRGTGQRRFGQRARGGLTTGLGRAPTRQLRSIAQPCRAAAGPSPRRHHDPSEGETCSARS